MKKLVFTLAFFILLSACSKTPAEVSWEECCALNTEVLIELVQFNQEMRNASALNQDAILKTAWSRLAEIEAKIQRQTDQNTLNLPENKEVKLALDQLKQILDSDYRQSRWSLDIGEEGYEKQLKEINDYLKEIEQILVD